MGRRPATDLQGLAEAHTCKSDTRRFAIQSKTRAGLSTAAYNSHAEINCEARAESQMFGWRHFFIVCMGLLMLSACSPRRADAEPGSWAYPVPASSYGQMSRLKGIYWWGPESMAIYLCDRPRRQCLARVSEVDGCWVEFSVAAHIRLGKRDDQVGEVWLEGIGRKTRRPGRFGHLGEYRCQVEIVEIRTVKTGPPYRFSIPPFERKSS